ncbi:MAG: AI-2E family transporter, partial [Polyangiaceae bacterium]|nr:AI-2E family transporter [Polyangiaceae bacterium]
MSAARGSKLGWARVTFFAVSAGGLLAILLVGQQVLLPFLLALVVAYVFLPLVRRVERLRVPRWVAILMVYAVIIGGAVAFMVATVPRLVEETKNLTSELPRLTARLKEEWLPELDKRLDKLLGGAPSEATPAPDPTGEPAAEPPAPDPKPAPIALTPRADGGYDVRVADDVSWKPNKDGSWRLARGEEERARFSSAKALSDALDQLVEKLQKNSGELLGMARSLVASVTRGVFYFFITLMLAAYLMVSYERIFKFLRDMWPEERRASFDRFVRRLDRGMGGVVRGQLLICVVNGVLSAIGFWLFGLKYWPVLAFVACVMSLIPIFGAILSSIPAVAIGLTQGFGTAFGALVWIIGIHQLEANFLNPKIIGDQAKIHPVLVVFALLLGEHLYSITG